MIETAPKLPPQNLEAERAVLGAILLDNRALAKAREGLVDADFSRTSHQKIYRAMLDLSDGGDAIDQITLTERLRTQGELQAVGGSSAIAELWLEVPSAANIRSHLKIVIEQAALRRFIENYYRAMEAAYRGAPLDEVALLAKTLRMPLVANAVPAAASRSESTETGLVKELADEILLTAHFARDAGNLLYVFQSGVYHPHGEAYIATRVKLLLELQGDTKRWSSHRAREVAEYLRVDARYVWTIPPVDVINLKNGLFDLATHTLLPHTPEHLSTVQLPVAFDPRATCPAWEEFLSQVMPADCQALAYELAALLMRPDPSCQQAVLCIGEGANGKSTLLAALTAFIGRENVSGLSLQRLECDKFSVVRLLGKLANICPDLPSDHLTSTSTFKSLTGGDPIPAERKFQSSFEFISFARLIFSANHYPQSKDSSAAFFRRWLVIPFERTFTPSEQTPRRELDARLAHPTELSGVFNRALDALAGITARGRLSQSESTQTAMMEFQEQTDPLAAWLDRFTQLNPQAITSKKDLHIAYAAYADANGRPPVSAKSFYAGVKRLRPAITEAQRRIHGEVRHVVLGIELRSQTKSEASPMSPDSPHSFQISLEGREIEREGEKKLTGDNAVNAATHATSDIAPCFTCESTRFWRSIHDSVVCASCHPPRSEALVREWIEAKPVRKW